MKKKITSFLAFVILAAGILLVVFLPGNKKATKRDGTATSADDNQDSIFLTVKMQILKLITMKVRQIKSNCLIL